VRKSPGKTDEVLLLGEIATCCATGRDSRDGQANAVEARVGSWRHLERLLCRPCGDHAGVRVGPRHRDVAVVGNDRVPISARR
jgi:hypothetical protein